MKQAPFFLAIPSHRRAAVLEAQTLAFLRGQNLRPEQIHVFLSDKSDAKAYAGLLDRGERAIVTGCKNLRDKFNFIHNYFPIGSRVVVMEDDVAPLEKGDGVNQKRPVEDLPALVARGFEAVADGGIWGVAPHANVFYMSGKVTRTLKLVVAHLFGFVSTHHKDLEVVALAKTDYERTLRYYLRYGETVRLDWVGVKTKSYTAAGGLQSDFSREARAAVEEESVDYLVRTFAGMVARNEKKKSLFPELSLKRVDSLPLDYLRARVRGISLRAGK